MAKLDSAALVGELFLPHPLAELGWPSPAAEVGFSKSVGLLQRVKRVKKFELSGYFRM